MNESRKLIQKGVKEIYDQEMKDNEERKLITGKIKNIIEKFGEATSEGGIYWNDKTTIYNNELERDITIDEHPLDIIADEIFKVFDNN